MSLRRKHKEGAEVATESLNDIMFFLLLFFLILSTLVNPSIIKLNLPDSKNSTTIEAQPVTVDVTKDLKYYIDNTQVDFGTLEIALQKALSKREKPTVVLRFDNSLTIQDLVDVMQIGNKLKIKMVMATRPANGA
jgi:biopolymer transport protein ExbD